MAWSRGWAPEEVRQREQDAAQVVVEGVVRLAVRRELLVAGHEGQRLHEVPARRWSALKTYENGLRLLTEYSHFTYCNY